MRIELMREFSTFRLTTLHTTSIICMYMQMKEREALKKELRDNSRIEACAIRFGTTGDVTRMKICYLLCHYPELSVSEIAHIIDAPVSTISHSLQKLKTIQLVEHRRKAKEVLYSFSHNTFAAVVQEQLRAEAEYA